MRMGIVVTVVLAIGAAATGVVVLHRSQAEPTREASQNASVNTSVPPTPVVAGTVTAHPVPIYLRGVGTVIAFNNVVVRSQITAP